MVFITHTGEQVSGERLNNALNKVADDWAKLGADIRKENAYAPHVTEKQKEDNLSRMIETSNLIRLGNIDSFTIWQRVNTALTGECVALLPKKS